MKVVSSFLPPVTAQPQLKGGESGASLVLTGERPESGLAVPVTAVAEIETVHEQSHRERIDLRPLREEPLPFNNLRALASYQTIAADPVASGSSIARLDIIV